MIATTYKDITVLSIAANGNEMSFSSDTGMAECLVIARKQDIDETAESQVCFASLSTVRRHLRKPPRWPATSVAAFTRGE